MTKLNGLAQIPLVIGLVVMAVAIPVAMGLVSKSQDTRNYAKEETGGYGSWENGGGSTKEQNAASQKSKDKKNKPTGKSAPTSNAKPSPKTTPPSGSNLQCQGNLCTDRTNGRQYYCGSSGCVETQESLARRNASPSTKANPPGYRENQPSGGYPSRAPSGSSNLGKPGDGCARNGACASNMCSSTRRVCL